MCSNINIQPLQCSETEVQHLGAYFLSSRCNQNLIEYLLRKLKDIKAMKSENPYSSQLIDQKSKELYKTLIEATTEGYWVIDTSAKTVEVNDALCGFLGYSKEEILGKTPFEFCDEENAKLLREQVAKIPTKDNRNYEIAMDRKDGSKVYFIVNATTLKSDDGKPLGGFAFFTDITYKKKIEKRLKESEERNRLLSNLSIDGIAIIQDGLIIDTNDALDKMLGYTKEELIGKVPFDFIDSRFRELALHNYTIRTSKPYEVAAIKRDGTSFPIELRGAMMPYKDGEVRTVIVRDLSYIKDAQNELIEQKEFLEALIDTVPIPVFYKDIDGRYLGCNSAFIDVFGFERDEVIGKSVYDIAPHEIAKKYDDEDKKLYSSSKTTQVYDFVVKHKKTGELLDVVFHKNIYRDKNGNPRGIIGAVLNMTEINRLIKEMRDLNEDLAQRVETEVNSRLNAVKKQEAQQVLLIQQSRMAALGEMIGAITHQWIQPLTVIGMLATDVAEMYDDKYLITVHEKIVSQVKFMSQTMNDFKNFFKPDKDFTLFDPHETSLKIVSMFKGQFEKKGIEIVLQQKDSFCAMGYNNEFQHVLLNLFNNAKDAILSNSNTRGKIVCVFEKSANLGVIKISDNGGGIKDELLPEKLFEPHVSTKGEGGTGIGLYICKTIIEKSMNGSIKARNTQNGSEFTIELTLSQCRVRASLLQSF
eukprot:TRINITY_DN93019_c0_g1_i1.p1 TRINITY_DN93019_c0_g1~~TRINITY_DN93019_c0_g1_i1.p1  ORF type:complete len:700 (-),score=63.04 TRINITY_DN93019_c0_g1_i1:206-2305(-)